MMKITQVIIGAFTNFTTVYTVGEDVMGSKITSISIDGETNPLALQIYLDGQLWKEYYGIPFELTWEHTAK